MPGSSISTPGGGQAWADPDYMGFQMWTNTPAQTYSYFQLAGGTFDVALVMCRRSTTITKMGCWVMVAGSNPVGGDTSGLAIYSSAGVLLGSTGNNPSIFESTGFQEASLTSGVPVVAGQAYYLCLLTAFNTEPYLMGTVTGNNQNLPEMNGLYASAYILAQTSFPASFSVGSLTGDTGTCFQTAR